MMRHHAVAAALALTLALGTPATPIPALAGAPSDQGQGQGQGKGQEQGRGNGREPAPGQARQGQGRARGQAQGQGRVERAPGADDPGNSGRARAQRRESQDGAGGPRRGGRPDDVELRRRIDGFPVELRRLATGSRRDERLVLGALAIGAVRGLSPDRIQVRSETGRVLVFNDDDDLLVSLDEAHARDLGSWQLRRLGDRRARADGPAFCRSGEGHPVWGRDWCLDKGFGLGSRSGRLWTRGEVDDIVFQRRDRASLGDLGWDDLLGVLGDVTLSRLALHALSLGYSAPLGGVWLAEPDAPRMLRIRAGDDVVAELVDRDRDDRVELLFVETFD